MFSLTHMYMCQEEGTRGIYSYYYIHDILGYETFDTGPRKHLLRSLLAGSVVAKSMAFFCTEVNTLPSGSQAILPQPTACRAWLLKSWLGASVPAMKSSGQLCFPYETRLTPVLFGWHLIFPN